MAKSQVENDLYYKLGVNPLKHGQSGLSSNTFKKKLPFISKLQKQLLEEMEHFSYIPPNRSNLKVYQNGGERSRCRENCFGYPGLSKSKYKP